eukprot:jgi/Mesvir1/26163/Mv06862-RA.1
MNFKRNFDIKKATYAGDVRAVWDIIDKCPEEEVMRLLKKVLLRSCKKGIVEMTALACKRGVSVDSRTSASKGSMTPLMIAAKNGYNEVVKLLLYFGAQVAAYEPQSLRTALHYAAEHGKEACCRSILNARDMTLKPRRAGGGSSPRLQVVPPPPNVRQRVKECVIVDAWGGATRLMNARTIAGESPLHLAAAKGHADIVRLLLDAGARTSVVTDDPPNAQMSFEKHRVLPLGRGNTPLHYAVAGGSSACVLMLLGAGADVFMRNADGNTSIDMASTKKNMHIAGMMSAVMRNQLIYQQNQSESANDDMAIIQRNRQDVRDSAQDDNDDGYGDASAYQTMPLQRRAAAAAGKAFGSPDMKKPLGKLPASDEDEEDEDQEDEANNSGAHMVAKGKKGGRAGAGGGKDKDGELSPDGSRRPASKGIAAQAAALRAKAREAAAAEGAAAAGGGMVYAEVTRMPRTATGDVATGAGAAKGGLTRSQDLLEAYRMVNNPGRPVGTTKKVMKLVPAGEAGAEGAAEGQEGEGAPAAAAAAEPVDLQKELMKQLGANSAYMKNVQEDIERYGARINQLAQAVRIVYPGSMDELQVFVAAVEEQLAVLSDEGAVLKAFDWPESKMDCMREASTQYSELLRYDGEMKSAVDDGYCKGLSARDAFAFMTRSFEKMEKFVEVLIRDKDSLNKRYKEQGIPWSWKKVDKLKQDSTLLAQTYMTKALAEAERLQDLGGTNLNSAKTVLVTTIKFIFKVHQFAGGFDEVCGDLFSMVKEMLQDLNDIMELNAYS